MSLELKHNKKNTIRLTSDKTKLFISKVIITPKSIVSLEEIYSFVDNGDGSITIHDDLKLSCCWIIKGMVSSQAKKASQDGLQSAKEILEKK